MSYVEAEGEVTVVEGLVAILLVGMEGAGVESVKEAAANSLGAIPFLHMIRSADAIEASSPSKVGPGRPLGQGRQGEEVKIGEELNAFLREVFDGEEREGDGTESCSSSESQTSSKLGEAVCQRCCSSLRSNVREILVTLIFNKGLFQGYQQRSAPRGLCSSEEAGAWLFV